MTIPIETNVEFEAMLWSSTKNFFASGGLDEVGGVSMSDPRLLHSATSGRHEVVVVEDGTVRYLFFDDPGSREIVSRMDMANPARLLAPYTQAMALALAWRRHPRVYLIGLGAGRLPFFLENFDAESAVVCSEIDDEVVTIARRFFGLEQLRRLSVVIEDGRTHLESLPPTPTFDLIMIDAFSGTGSTPLHLSTIEFYRSCRARLGPLGVVVLNILDSDERFDDKVETLRRSFEHLHHIQIDRSNIYFAADQPVDQGGVATVAAAIDAALSEPGTFGALAHSLHAVERPPSGAAGVLID